MIKIILLLICININFSFASIDPWSFIVMSDIHIYPSGKIPEHFKTMVAHVKDKKPDLVFITGDHTNGNRGDSHSPKKVSYWYQQLDKALTPLFEAGIIVIPIVGNHDYYETKHKEAYKVWAQRTLKKSSETLEISLNNPVYFNFKYKKQEFFIFKLWTQVLDSDQKKWFVKASQHLPKNFRFGFGHVPLKSVIGRTSTSFYKTVGELFSKSNINIYFAGHEHTHWDQLLPFDNLRQITVGTTSGTYNFPLRRQVRDLHCRNNKICTMPNSNNRFLIEQRNDKNGYQVYKQNFVEVIFDSSKNYQIYSYGLGIDSSLVNFYLD